jgi:glycosyltransferase involved in cell wall biosynthesis
VTGPATARPLSRVVVDFTPLVAGGANGGAKPMTIELVQGMGLVAPEVEFLLLTSPAGHDDLAGLDAPNIRRLLLSTEHVAPAPKASGQARSDASAEPVRLRRRLYRALSMRLPHRAIYLIDRSYGLSSAMLRTLRWAASGRVVPETRRLISRLGGDLLFCPFTAPYFHDPSVPTVSLVHDLQFRQYPRFFSEEERQGRERDFRQAVALADVLTCTSEFVRGSILEAAAISPQRTVAVHPRLAHRLPPSDAVVRSAALARLALVEGEYVLYPANFWRHKNHDLLLTAFGLYRTQNPMSRLRLVCTGEPDAGHARFVDSAVRMGLAEWVVAPGYVAAETLSALFDGAAALVFPSLYEGFGLPVLEAMAHSIPVVCSRSTSLPEIAGDAALYVDARSPMELAEAIERITSDSILAARLVTRGSVRLATLGTSDAAARSYLELFRGLLFEKSVPTVRRRWRLGGTTSAA